ncbi:MAG TPA: exodeoxyribonuclease V subunit gamma [Arachidicoccus sp.]|nr:exodeoxyribonuclease V subunit gamma [Arachidicoccus sp.]
MAFQLNASNSLNQLAAALCRDLNQATTGVFQPYFIITQTEGMNNWLNIQLANRIGVAAGFRFLKPNDLVYRIYYLLGGKSSKTLSVENLSWLFFQLLGTTAFKEKFKEIAAYYSDEYATEAVTSKDTNDVKRLALAKKVADLFDQYQIYRSDMIEGWNQDEAQVDFDDSGMQYMESWQAYLWMEARKIAGESFPNKVQIGKDIKDALQDPVYVEQLQKRMPAIYFFGISLLTQFHLKIFEQLSDYLHIHFYLLNPAPNDYWFDDLSAKKLAFLKKIGKIDQGERSLGHPLLLNWGKIIQDTFGMLFNNEEILNSYEELPVVVPPSNSLLHKVQYAIFENQIPAEGELFDLETLKDNSIVINACYSPLREVEVLYNYLVHLVDKKKQLLSPRDIVVMVSDIDLYAAYIKAVFDHAPYLFPYKIADESFVYSDSITGALQAILTLEAEAFTAEAVVRLLDAAYIRKRQQISQVNLIRQTLDQANIRFGMEGNYTDDSAYVSWTYGLKRIMYGICLSGSEEFGTGPDSFYPIDEIEGAAASDVIRFVHFAQQLMLSIQERSRSRTLTQWAAYIENLLQQFICNEEDITDEDYAQLLIQLTGYNDTADLFQTEVSYDVFMESFMENLSRTSKGHAFATGGITFCSLIPMRSIPFKVIALLGLDFDKFPRKEHPLGFNLMEKVRRKGDRNVKENDKHLFLETLLSAGDFLYISYIGQSIKDNSSIPASSLVDELIDYIATYSEDPVWVRDHLVSSHPLHGFSRRYFTGDPALHTYLLQAYGVNDLPASPSHESTKINPEEGERKPQELTLEKFMRFLKQPIKGYYNDILGIYYDDSDNTLRDAEMFELDALQRWQLREELLGINTLEDREALRNRLVKTGKLPLKNMSNWVMTETEDEVAMLRSILETETAGAEETNFQVHLDLGDYHLTGTISGLYDHKFIVHCWSISEEKYLVTTYIQYLILRASGLQVTTCFISNRNGGVYYGEELSVDAARGTLLELLNLFAQGHQQPLVFIHGLVGGPENLSKLDAQTWEKIIRKEFDRSSDHGSYRDPYLDKAHEMGIFEGVSAMAAYQIAAKQLYLPLPHFFRTYPFGKK